MTSKLTNKQQAFVEHYLRIWNATEAARQAGYSDKTAYAQGSRLLKNAEVETEIAQRLKELKMGADEVLSRLSSHARGSMADFLNVAGQHIDLEQAKERGLLHLIKKIKVTTTTGEDFETHRVELELYDAQSALVQLGRHHKLFTDKVEVDDYRADAAEIGLSAEQVDALQAILLALPAPQRDRAHVQALLEQLFGGTGLGVQVIEGESRLLEGPD